MPQRLVPSLLIALALLAPLLGAGMFARALWTPDEPREADIAWRMSVQPNRVLPEFGGRLFLEKPPLSYWMSGEGIRQFGNSAAAARVPNILYSIAVSVALFLLAANMVGAQGALPVTLVAGSALLAWRVGIWLAPDAALMAGVAVALLGAWRGYTAETRGARLLWYTLMHAGAAWGFMAKSAAGWLVPTLALITLIVWERRWRELGRVELWAGLLLQAALIAPWIALVLRQPAGVADLQALFWNNLVGRFADVQTYGGPRYAVDHQNYFAKYFLELPLYLLPWTALVAAAAWRARRAARAMTSVGRRWRFAIAASLPWLLLLSFAATARDVYASPAIIGCALLIGLLVADDAPGRAAGDPGDPQVAHIAAPGAHRVTGWLIVAIGFALLMSGTLLLIARQDWSRADSWRAVALVAIAVVVVTLAMRYAAALRSGAQRTALVTGYVAFALPVVTWALAFFPLIDSWQDLPGLSLRIARDTAAQPFALLDPDETTIGTMERVLGRPQPVVLSGSGDVRAIAAAAGEWLRAQGPGARLLVKLPGHAPGEITRWIATHTGRRLWSEDDGRAASLERAGVAHIVSRYELPQGRRYALLAALP
jgi:4-amino-4-deoxy-L-arabinose transferase-like glycosyltransferase